MSLLHRIADYFDPRPKQELNSVVISANNLKGSNNALVERLGDAAVSVQKLRGHRKTLREALITTRDHVMNVYDDELAKLEALGARSKLRIEQSAVVETIRADLKKIADALNLTSDDKAAS
jgi:hypothetical protein